MNIATTYMGLKLSTPLIIGASPLGDKPDQVRELVDAGAAALVMHSLFQEQLDGGHFSTVYLREMYAESQPQQEGLLDPAVFRVSPEEYLRQIQRIRKVVNVPVIGSLNGSRPGGWIHYAEHIEQAGADALELNLYAFPSDPAISGNAVEQQMLDIIRMVAESVRIPVAVKLSPFLSSLPNFAAEAQKAGAAGLVLFNRVYQAEVEMDVPPAESPEYHPDNSHLQIRLYWLAVLALHLKISLAISGGVNSGDDVFKSVKAGAHAGQVVSAVLRDGPAAIRRMLAEFEKSMREHQCNSIEELRGRMRFDQLPDPETCERIRYMRTLQKWSA